MAFTHGFPFHRLGVDHMVRGVSRVWWQLQAGFHDAGPYTYQLQHGRAGTATATDWNDVGEPAEDAGELLDEEQRVFGSLLDTYYRVVLTTTAGEYVSAPIQACGQLREQDWLLAREIVRKEKLRHSLASRYGYLLRRMRHTEKLADNRDHLTGNVISTRDPGDYGTGFVSGYFTPVPAQCWDMAPRQTVERRNAAAGVGQQHTTTTKARALGWPHLYYEDVWVDAASDERWHVENVRNVVEVRGVPVIFEVTLGLLPFSDIAYSVEIGGEPADRDGPLLVASGTGSVVVDHDYNGVDSLAFKTAEGVGVGGATIRAFTAADHTAGRTGIQYVLARTSTRANGRWAAALKLDPGEYVLTYTHVGKYAAVSLPLTVE